MFQQQSAFPMDRIAHKKIPHPKQTARKSYDDCEWRLSLLQGKNKVSLEHMSWRFISASAVCWPVPHEGKCPNTSDSCQNNGLEGWIHRLTEPLKLFLDIMRNVKAEYLFLLKVSVTCEVSAPSSAGAHYCLSDVQCTAMSLSVEICAFRDHIV